MTYHLPCAVPWFAGYWLHLARSAKREGKRKVNAGECVEKKKGKVVIVGSITSMPKFSLFFPSFKQREQREDLQTQHTSHIRLISSMVLGVKRESIKKFAFVALVYVRKVLIE